MIHKFQSSIEGIPLPEKFTCPFCYTPHPLCVKAVEEVQGYLRKQSRWTEELAEGKMFGILVVRTTTNEIGYLAAFSGNLGHSNKHDFFVPPVFDLLDPDGFFICEEKQISGINEEIKNIIENSDYSCLKKQLDENSLLSEMKIKDAKDYMEHAKTIRNSRRKENPDEKVLAEMIRESQFLKAELKRLIRSFQEREMLLREQFNVYEQKINKLSEERKARSNALQRRLFDSFRVLNAKGEVQGLYDIFEKSVGKLPPAGAGDCAAPKLLQYAYKNKMHPLAMAEFWWKDENYGAPTKGASGSGIKTFEKAATFSEVAINDDSLRRHGYYYPACKSKCEPILNFMMQGLDVEQNPLQDDSECNRGVNIYNLEKVFEDEWLVVVNKPAGMLSVPGKGSRDSVYSLMKSRYPDATGPLIVHRLDMDTSGLMIVAKTKDVHKEMQKLFASGNVEKCYVAILEGVINNVEGEILLPLCLDPEDRPRQMVNYEFGKTAITRYKVLTGEHSSVGNGDAGFSGVGDVDVAIAIAQKTLTAVLFYPKTGRTHQLRVHAAHRNGLNAPIKGDRLYGQPSGRLYLHAKSLKFTHPITGEDIHVEKDVDFDNITAN